MKQFYMMVGVPGVGKTTWIKNNLFPVDLSISTDNIMETLGSLYGMTYNELFDNITYSFAEKMMYKVAKYHFSKKELPEIVVWDQTNLTAGTRKKKLDLVPKEYHKTAVYFNIPMNHYQRLANRPDKVIPENVLTSMIKQVSVPDISEGFDKVIMVDNKNFK